MSFAVPRHLHPTLGTRLKRPLGTDSLSRANVLKIPVVAAFRDRIAAAGCGAASAGESAVRAGLALAPVIAAARTESELRAAEGMLAELYYPLIGAGAMVVRDDTGELIEIPDPGAARIAGEALAAARGNATPLDAFHGDYLKAAKVSKRTKDDDVRALARLAEWCRSQAISPTLEAVTSKVAIGFVDSLGVAGRNLDPVTCNKYVNRLSQYWAYMKLREHVPENVWPDKYVPAPAKTNIEKERPFTDDEVRRLLVGGAPAKLMDLMMIGALTGARIDAVVDLKVGDIVDGAFRFKPQKREAGEREVPIHPDLAAIVKRRTAGKAPSDDFFPEWPGPKKPDSKRERSFKASNAFTEYRRACGVDDCSEGRRRSRVNFHSFRRWFITKAERATGDGDLVAAIVGHKRKGMTFGLYSGGPLFKRAKACIAKVQLPPLNDRPVKEERGVMLLLSATPGKTADRRNPK
ncbi:tyrosine-type recombinase/integrase [Nostoc sp. NIES-2111]